MLYRRLLLLAIALLAASQVHAQAPDAGKLYDQMKEARAQQYAWQRMPGSTPEEKTARETERVRANEAVVRAAGAFLAAFPEDPRKLTP